jgi:hypothetical protein
MNTFNAPATPTAFSTPSISSAAMLVELAISTWTGRKLDKRASQEVTTQNKAAVGVANVNKKLLGDCPELDAIQKFAGNVRTLHYHHTLPWTDGGLRLLTTARYFDYQKNITSLKQDFEKLVTAFLSAYDWEIAQAQVKLGDLFNAAEYPSADNIRNKFAFRINYMPVPEVGDWRVDINNEAKDLLTEQYESYYTTQLNNAMSDVWKRTHVALSKMVERLDYSDNETKKIFRDSLVDNVMEVVDLMKTCNVIGDMQMAATATRLENLLIGITPDALREDDYLRTETKDSVAAVLKTLPSLDL